MGLAVGLAVGLTNGLGTLVASGRSLGRRVGVSVGLTNGLGVAMGFGRSIEVPADVAADGVVSFSLTATLWLDTFSI